MSTNPSAPAARERRAPEGPELYGDHTLEWWTQAFAGKNDDIQLLQSSITTKRQYIDIFEGGRRFGQVFGAGERSTYDSYKKELPEDEKKLQTLKDELDELRRKATIAGVPREIRER